MLYQIMTKESVKKTFQVKEEKLTEFPNTEELKKQ